MAYAEPKCSEKVFPSQVAKRQPAGIFRDTGCVWSPLTVWTAARSQVLRIDDSAVRGKICVRTDHILSLTTQHYHLKPTDTKPNIICIEKSSSLLHI